MDAEMKNCLALDVLVNNEKVNVFQLSGKLHLPLLQCSQNLEGWLNSCPATEKDKISREFMVKGEDEEGHGYIRVLTEESFNNLDKKGITSFLFSVEKNRHDTLSSTNTYQGGSSSFKRIKLTTQLRKGTVQPSLVPEVKKEPTAPKPATTKEVVVKREEPVVKRDTVVSKFFSEKPKEKPPTEPKKIEKSPDMKQTKSDSGSDKDAKVSPIKGKPVAKPAPEKKADGKFKGKAAPAGNRMITSFFTKAPKTAIPATPVPKPKEEPRQETHVETAKKRPLSEEKSPVPERKSPPKKKKMSKKKPKVKAGTSRILQIADEDSSEDEEMIDRKASNDKDEEQQNVVLENEEVREKTPPRPYKEKKKKTITECYKDEDGYDNITFKEVDCSSEEEH
ncbi:titin-like [Phlebotomus argentipes]|uniref:titin-like n=1 Tax=Phlebotomus argentipes TaxID=94469 RepID=UPI0028936F34|nr:titin-like [Phlebotomus argentipes]